MGIRRHRGRRAWRGSVPGPAWDKRTTSGRRKQREKEAESWLAGATGLLAFWFEPKDIRGMMVRFIEAENE